ncbi:MAG TPA: hypothetical protein VGM22_26600 [Methylomirabilota bacterium]
MTERGLTLHRHHAKRLGDMGTAWDYVITVCDAALADRASRLARPLTSTTTSRAAMIVATPSDCRLAHRALDHLVGEDVAHRRGSFHGRGRLQRPQHPVHPPRRAAGGHRHRDLGPGAHAIAKQLGRHLGQLSGVARDHEPHRLRSVPRAVS